MSGSTIPTGGTVTLTSSLSGNITFANVGTDSGVLLIEPGALSFGPSTGSVVQTYLGGNILGFSPGDTIILANLEQDYANFDKSPSSASNNASFNSDISLAASNNVDILIEPGNVITTNNALINFEFGAQLQTLAGPYLGSIDQALFGTDSLAATLTLALAFEPGGTAVDAVITTSEPLACFTTGTRITAVTGDRPVEHLRPGDRVITASGIARPVRWIGHRRIDCRNHPEPALVQPIRIQAGALADGVPIRDLLVSPDHALLLDGVLIQAKDIVDGVLITRDQACASVTYYHVELDTHDIVLAEGAPAESFLDTGHRGVFANAAEPVTLHPDLMNSIRTQGGCAELVTSGPRLAAVRAHLAARKRALGYRIVEASPKLRIGNTLLAAERTGTGELRFDLPHPARRVELITGSFVPAEVDETSADRRRLGAAITAITLDGAPLPLDRVIQAARRHPRAVGDKTVWTTGDVMLSLPHTGRRLVVTCAAIARNWQVSAPAAERIVAHRAR